MRKGFTLIEVLVAMAVLALMIAFASMVFTVSIDTYRVSMATAEIMQKLRVVTDQLDNDLRGLRRDAPILIQFNLDDPNRYDQMMFFADGDFSSIQLYDTITGRPATTASTQTTIIRGNIARIFYGQANVNNHNPGTEPRDPKGPIERRRILARRQHILSADDMLDNWPNSNMTDLNIHNEDYEHDRLSVADWKTINSGDWTNVPDVCFITRPQINTNTNSGYHKLFCEGVGSFSIQWAYWNTTHDRLDWYPNRINLVERSNEFGIYFNADSITGWHSITDVEGQYRENNQRFFPAALKFNFTLYDSKGVIKNGMMFSHIVYLER